MFRYLGGTKDWRLIYGGNIKGLEGYTDGASQEHKHTISGYAFLIEFPGHRKQELVTLSTAEAGHVAAMYAVKVALWLRHLIKEVFRPLTNPIMHCSESLEPRSHSPDVALFI